MILSNFILLFTLNKNYSEDSVFEQSSYVAKNILIANDIYSEKYSTLLISNNKITKEHNNLPDVPLLSGRFVYPNISQRFLNKYLQETIFLSPASKVNNLYINLLKNKGLSIYNTNENRSFLNKFSKDLINGRIDVKFNDSFIKLLNYSNFSYLKYSWHKTLHFQILKIVHFKNNVISFFLNDKVFLLNRSIPLFVLSNDSNEIIMSESVNQISKLGYLSTFYDNFTYKLFSNSGSKKSYTCLIFVSHNDAIEYRDFLKYKNSFSTNSLNIKVVPCNLGLYFNLKLFFADSVDFRLVPDLKEVSNLLYKYRKYRHISFDQTQKYGRNFFQGQPLYTIKELNFKNLKKSSLMDKKSCFLISTEKYNNLNTFFLNYNTVKNTWKKFREENQNIRLPKDPQISVSNLELFIKRSEKEKEISGTVFLPSIETYRFIKEYLIFNLKKQSNLSNWLSNTGLVMKTMCCRIFWSLASRQPNSL